MKANELRQGNYVSITPFKDETDVLQLNEEEIEILYIFKNWDRIKPIPLTEEWLLKFGFEQKGSFYRIKNSRFAEVIVHDKGIDVCNHSVCLDHVKSVHQLQNLYFALTNEELTIKQ